MMTVPATGEKLSRTAGVWLAPRKDSGGPFQFEGLGSLFRGSGDRGEPVRKQGVLHMLSFAQARFSLA